jgi:Flp pilus assembly pilin Flp
VARSIGGSAVEYALIACIVALVIVFAVAADFSPGKLVAILQAISDEDERVRLRPGE